MARQTAAAIQREIHNCIVSCERSRDLVAGLAQFLADLRQKGWDHEDVRIVENRVLKILANLASSTPASDDFHQIELKHQPSRQPTKWACEQPASIRADHQFNVNDTRSTVLRCEGADFHCETTESE